MRIIADRFLLDDADVVDLATGEIVRVTIDRSPPHLAVPDRYRVCDALAMLRHPLLMPLVDYGLAGELWFEAHASLPPFRAAGPLVRASALHLVRFLRAHEVELTAGLTARHVRPAIEHERAPSIRPLGLQLAWRAAVDAVRLVIEAGGGAGIASITLSGAVGAGLRSARLALARVARLAGYFVVDSRLSAVASTEAQGRHCCVIDWLPSHLSLPPLLAQAALGSARRHLWLRFTRDAARADCAIALDPLTSQEMAGMVYRDLDLGPDHDEVRAAIQRSRGWPGSLVQRLTAPTASRAAAWIHETAPEYVVVPRCEPHLPRAADADAGVRRLLRVLRAAERVAAHGRHARAERLFRRCAGALAVRGALTDAADAAAALGGLLLRRGRAEAALTAFQRARDLRSGDAFPVSLLTDMGRVLALLKRTEEAEAALRAALASSDASGRAPAAARLADLLLRKGEHERASEALRAAEPHPRVALVAGELRLRAGDLAAASEAARGVLAAAAAPDEACEAHLLLARIHHALGEQAAADRAARAALAAARRAHDPSLQLLAWAARTAAAPSSERTTRRRERLLAASRRLPPSQAEDLRALLSPDLRASGIPSAPDLDALESMLGLCEAAADEEQAVVAVVRHLHEVLGAASVAAWTARDFRPIAIAGRPWVGTAIAQLTVNAGRGSLTRGVLLEASDPVRAGGISIGCVAARWAADRAPAEAHVRRMLRFAAAAVAPVVAALNSPHPPVVQRTDCPDDLLGAGPCAEQLRAVITRAAGAPFPVLIEGESGSGKELVARGIHARSSRRARRFCAVNCAALTEDLLEAELFGHARGAFTGAAGDRAGLFEDADQGTVFLDEVAELSPRAQAKLLRVLQEGEVRRVGENIARRVDVRILAATNRPLEAEVAGGRFRADLRFRLDVIRVVVPPLRERPDEIPALANRIWREAAARVGTRATLGAEVMSALARYGWPGNVRELQNVLAALAVHAPLRGRVPASLLPARVADVAGRTLVGFDEARFQFERRFVQAALGRAAGRKGLAAAQLGVSRQGLDKMLKRLGIGEPV